MPLYARLPLGGMSDRWRGASPRAASERSSSRFRRKTLLGGGVRFPTQLQTIFPRAVSGEIKPDGRPDLHAKTRHFKRDDPISQMVFETIFGCCRRLTRHIFIIRDSNPLLRAINPTLAKKLMIFFAVCVFHCSRRGDRRARLDCPLEIQYPALQPVRGAAVICLSCRGKGRIAQESVLLISTASVMIGQIPGVRFPNNLPSNEGGLRRPAIIRYQFLAD